MSSDEGPALPGSRTLSEGSIKLMKQEADGQFHEVEYGNLDTETKETVLTELLVKSAISHALQKTEVTSTNQIRPLRMHDSHWLNCDIQA